MRKKAAVAVLLILVLALFAGCSSAPGTERVKSARIRYFDGSLDTVLISRYTINGGTVTIWTDQGRVCVLGANNVMIIEEDEDQQN